MKQKQSKNNGQLWDSLLATGRLRFSRRILRFPRSISYLAPDKIHIVFPVLVIRTEAVIALLITQIFKAGDVCFCLHLKSIRKVKRICNSLVILAVRSASSRGKCRRRRRKYKTRVRSYLSSPRVSCMGLIDFFCNLLRTKIRAEGKSSPSARSILFISGKRIDGPSYFFPTSRVEPARK